MTAPRKRRVFPFTAVIGQEEMKLALLLNVIDPRIGHVDLRNRLSDAGGERMGRDAVRE